MIFNDLLDFLTNPCQWVLPSLIIWAPYAFYWADRRSGWCNVFAAIQVRKRGVVRCHQTVIETLNSIKTKKEYPTAAQRGYEKMNICISFGMLLVSCHVRQYEKPKPYVIISKVLSICVMQKKSAVKSSFCTEVNDICK